MKKIIALGIILLFFTGCATTSRLVHLKAQPPVTDLFPDEKDIAEIIEEIKTRPPSTSKAVTWDGEYYKITPEAYEKILNDKIYLMALKKKVQEFAEDYDPHTLSDAWRQDLGTSLITLFLILGITLY